MRRNGIVQEKEEEESSRLSLLTTFFGGTFIAKVMIGSQYLRAGTDGFIFFSLTATTAPFAASWLCC